MIFLTHKLKLKAAIGLMLMVFLTTACLAQDKKTQVAFKKDKLIEVALLTIKPGKESQFSNDYFSKAWPIGQPYEPRMIGQFAIQDKVGGNNPAQLLVFFEWGSLEQKRAFEKNLEFVKIVNIRNEALSFLTTGYFMVDQDITYELSAEGTYEFAALWLDPTEAHKLEQYFQAVLPLASDPKIQFQLIAQLKSLGVEDKNYHPNIIFFSEWKEGMEGRAELAQRQAFKESVHLREEASPYKDMLIVKPIIQ